MNLNAYDNVIDQIDKTKSWIYIKKKQLISREIKYRRYNTILKRYNSKTKCYSYYIAMLDEPDITKVCSITKLDNYGRIKINIANIWNETSLRNIDKDCNIDVQLYESTDDGDVYILDI